MTNDQIYNLLAPIRPRFEAATKGPFRVVPAPNGHFACVNDADEMNVMSTLNGTPVLGIADAILFAAARADIQRLVAAIESVEVQAQACDEMADITPNETAAEALRLAARGIRSAIRGALKNQPESPCCGEGARCHLCPKAAE